MNTFRSGVAFLSCAVIILVTLWPVAGVAQTLPAGAEVESWAQHKVLVYPPRFPVYLDLDTAVEGELDVRQLRRAVRRHFELQPYFVAVDVPTSVEDMPNRTKTAEKLFDANESLALGEQYFLSFSLDSAVSELQKAVEDFDVAFGGTLSHENYARAWQFLAFSLLERSAGQPDAASDRRAARDAMMELVRLAPSVVLDPARQPAARVELYREARRLVLGNRLWREPSADHARRVASTLQIDFVAFPRVVQSGDALVFELDVFDARSGEFTRSDTTLTESPERDADLVDAALSRFSSGVLPRPAPPRVDTPKEAGRIYIDTGFTYFVYLDTPTRTPFDNLGAKFAATWMVTENFSVVGRFALAVSGSDRDKDLQSSFNTFRGLVGVGLSADFEWIRPWLVTGVELAKPTRFLVTREPYCKAPFGTNDQLCNPSDLNEFDVALLAGLGGVAGVDIGVNPIFFKVAASFAFYVFPFDEGKELNFPLGFDLGVEYRF